MVIDQGVDVVVADLGLLVALWSTVRAAAVGAPAAAVGDAAELLDVHVDQLAGPVAFVADRGGLRGPDHLTGHRVALAQVGHAVAAQDPRHRAGRHAELGAEPVRPAAVLGAGREDLLPRPRRVVRVGIVCGREDRSTSPASPSAA